MPEKVKILFLAANPKDTVRLRLGEEQREIEQKILLAQKKDCLILVNKGAVRVGDLQFYLNQERPTIVHFSGHGSDEGKIILEDNLGNARTIPPAALTRVFKILKDNIRCVVLNACFSLEQARAISQHIDCVVGMSSYISDGAAIAFSTAFYLAIASERSIKNAFDQGINALMLWEISEDHIPQLLLRDNVNSSKIFLFEPKLPRARKNSTELLKFIENMKQDVEYVEGIQAHLFFPVGTPEEHKTLDYHKKYLHHRLIVNHKTNPPKAYYMTPGSYGWEFIRKYPHRWVSEIVSSDIYLDDPNFTKRWCDEKGYKLKPWTADKKDLIEVQ